jgi:hypothetical protein
MSLCQVQFIDPERKIEGEGKSKLLCPSSELYTWIVSIQERLRAAKIVFDARPPHIEISSTSNLNSEEFNKRAQLLQNKNVSKEVFVLADKALVVYTGILNFYGQTHATVAYFTEGLSTKQYDILCKIIADQATEEDIIQFKSEVVNKPNNRFYEDWWCKTCEFKIFGSKSECRKCGTRRPG